MSSQDYSDNEVGITIFPLYMESNTLEKSTNNSIAFIFYSPYAFNDSQVCDVVDSSFSQELTQLQVRYDWEVVKYKL